MSSFEPEPQQRKLPSSLDCSPEGEPNDMNVSTIDKKPVSVPERSPGGSLLRRLFSRSPRTPKTSGRSSLSTGRNQRKMFNFYKRSVSEEEQKLSDMTEDELKEEFQMMKVSNNLLEFYNGDVIKAILHHEKTLQWRATNNIDRILEKKPKHWSVLKSECNTYLYGACDPVQIQAHRQDHGQGQGQGESSSLSSTSNSTSKKSYIVIDKLVCTDLAKMRQNNIKPEDLGKTIAFLEEYYKKKLYHKLYSKEPVCNPDSSINDLKATNGTTTSTTTANDGGVDYKAKKDVTLDDFKIFLIMDCKHVNLMKFISLDQLKFKNSQPIILEEHYTGSIEKVLVINHPMVFQLFFAAIKQVFPKSFTDKFVFIRAAKDFAPYLKAEDVPIEYKGKSHRPVETSPDHLEYLEFLDSLPESE